MKRRGREGMRLRWGAALGALVLACAGADPGPSDAGTSLDAGQAVPRCLPMWFPGWEGWEGPPPLEQAIECGICVAPHERILGWARTPIAEMDPHAVPEGLLVSIPSMGAYVALVRHDGTVQTLAERPFADLDDEAPVHTYVAPIPGQPRFWVVNERILGRPSLLAPLRTHHEVVLYSYDEGGFRREAAGDTPYHFERTLALAGGELFAYWNDAAAEVGSPGSRLRLGRVRALPDGTVDLYQEDDFPIEGDLDYGAGWELFWPARDGGVFIVVPFSAVARRSGELYVHRDAWLVRLGPDLEIASDPVRLGVDPFDPDYTGEPDENHPTPFVTKVVRHASGWVSLVSQGTIPRVGAADASHFWVQWISPDGELLHPSPGILANETDFVSDEVLPSRMYYSESFLFVAPLPLDRVALAWADFQAPMPGTLWAQVVDPDGSLPLSEPFDFGPTERFPAVFTQDGLGRTYGMFRLSYSTPDRDPRNPRFTFEAMAYGGELETLWPERSIGTCEREGEATDGFEGDAADGVWLVWQEALRERTGRLAWVLKVAWIRSDGTYAWSGE